jgi:hypothetical protein
MYIVNFRTIIYQKAFSKMAAPGEKKEDTTQTTTQTGSASIDLDAELEKLIRDIWDYIHGYTESPPMQYNPKVVRIKWRIYLIFQILAVLRKAYELIEAESTVLDLKGTICIVGGLHGQADTLISLFSTMDLPPLNTFLFLGNYAGQGFGPHECLLLLLALKVRYPKHVYLLKGNLEDPEVLKVNSL